MRIGVIFEDIRMNTIGNKEREGERMFLRSGSTLRALTVQFLSNDYQTEINMVRTKREEKG